MIDDDDKPATPPAADDKAAPPPAPEGRPELLNAHLKHESGAVKGGVIAKPEQVHRAEAPLKHEAKGVGAEMQQLVIDPCGRLAVLLHQDGRLPGAPAGRPRKLAADTEQTMQQVLLEAIVDYRGRHEGALPNDQRIMDAACKIAEHVGVSVSDKTLKRRVIKPVVKGLRQGK
jgi:hypothetical protein